MAKRVRGVRLTREERLEVPLVNFEIEVYPNNISITVAVASLAVAL
jgi:hypothetical protein